MDCGATCLRMVAHYYGKHFTTDTLRKLTSQSRLGVSMLSLSEAAEQLGFRTRGAHLTYKELSRHAILPCILHWDQRHYAVAMSFGSEKKIKVADPAKGILTFTRREFEEHWISTQYKSDNEPVGSVLLLDPTAQFYQQENQSLSRLSWKWLLGYLKKSSWELGQVFVLLLITSLLQLIFPFLTQSIVDTGISTKNLSFISIVLIAQLMLVFSTNISEFIRNRLLLQVSSMLNLSILSDFWIKLTKLPISYFSRSQIGDIMQRIDDHKTIQDFLTSSALSTFFSTINFLVYVVILALYNPYLLLLFLGGSLLYFSWILFFLKILRKINYQNFYLSSKENNSTLQLIEGMPEIKLNNAEHLKRWEWEGIQSRIFKLSFKSLSFNQLQQGGATLINQGKDVFITFYVAGLVIEGQLTLGAMLAIQYIIGQLSSPIEQLISFVQQGQEAKIGMERLNEIHEMDDEESQAQERVSVLPEDHTIEIKGLAFTYPGSHDPVLEDINLTIPQGKMTAIVGSSGSGKTTLLKLLLKFYENYKGEISVGGNDFRTLSPSFWRRNCGTVMQDGFVFNDTVARNIAVMDQFPDEQRLVQSCRIANILDFVEGLPNGFNTQLGSAGQGISQGQRQRILIARAVYKNPQYLFFDEATNALDANNEKYIVEKLDEYFEGRTVVVVAHRLSTVRNANNIVVIEAGKIIEQGDHEYLTAKRGKYYELVKNQLELGE